MFFDAESFQKMHMWGLFMQLHVFPFLAFNVLFLNLLSLMVKMLEISYQLGSVIATADSAVQSGLYRV